MAGLLHRVGLWVARHPLPVVIGWVAVIVLMVLLVARIGALTTNDLTLPGTDSQRATDLLAALIESISDQPVLLLGHSMGGQISATLALRRR